MTFQKGHKQSGHKKKNSGDLQAEVFATALAKDPSSFTKAYMVAFPNASYLTARAAAYKYFRREHVQAKLKERMAAANIEASEIIGTHVEQMRGDISLMLDDEGKFDITKARENDVTHLIKKILTKPDGTVIAVEMHDQGLAAERLGKVFGLEKLPARNPADEDFMRQELRKSIEAIMASDNVTEKAAKKLLAAQLKNDPEWAPYVSELVN